MCVSCKSDILEANREKFVSRIRYGASLCGVQGVDMGVKPVVLCGHRRSVYLKLGCDVYDESRDAFTFLGDRGPVIAHPPCRLWSPRVSHQAKCENPERERELGLRCAFWVRSLGGCLEQPSRSRLFASAGLPQAVDSNKYGFTVRVDQSWWGFPTLKPTWIFFTWGCVLPAIPFSLVSNSHYVWQYLTKRQRSETPESFARWLIQAVCPGGVL
jgi:hypothetical protein